MHVVMTIVCAGILRSGLCLLGWEVMCLDMCRSARHHLYNVQRVELDKGTGRFRQGRKDDASRRKTRVHSRFTSQNNEHVSWVEMSKLRFFRKTSYQNMRRHASAMPRRGKIKPFLTWCIMNEVRLGDHDDGQQWSFFLQLEFPFSLESKTIALIRCRTRCVRRGNVRDDSQLESTSCVYRNLITQKLTV